LGVGEALRGGDPLCVQADRPDHRSLGQPFGEVRVRDCCADIVEPGLAEGEGSDGRNDARGHAADEEAGQEFGPAHIQSALKAPFEDLDRSLYRAKLAVREAFELGTEHLVGRRTAVELVAPPACQPKREPSAMFGVGLTFDEAGADERIDRAADRGSAPLDGGGDFVERGRLAIGDCCQQLSARGLGTFNRAIRHPLVDDCREPRGKSRRRVRGGKLLHNNSLNSNKVVRVNPAIIARSARDEAIQLVL